MTALTRLEDVASTMELAHAAGAEGAPHGTSFVAARQTRGRGSRGRPWESPRGGLWLSVLARPERADAFAALSLRVGLAIADALEGVISDLPMLQVKWPNDLLAEGRKVAGILCEASWSGPICRWVVVGVGINVQNAVTPDMAPFAARCAEWDASVAVEQVLHPVLEGVVRASRTAGPLTDAELAAYGRRDALLGRHVLEPVPGMAVGISPDGALLVQDPAGRAHTILAGLVLDSV